jgi:hypothetical protein
MICVRRQEAAPLQISIEKQTQLVRPLGQFAWAQPINLDSISGRKSALLNPPLIAKDKP